MIRSRNSTGHQIHAALRKLGNKSNVRELALIDLVASVYDCVKETKDSAVGKVQDAATDVNNSVHAHPWYYLGGAALIGIVGSLFLRR